MDEEARQRDVGSARCEPGFAEASVVRQRLVPLTFATHHAEGASVDMELSPWIELAICRQQNLHITFVGDDVF